MASFTFVFGTRVMGRDIAWLRLVLERSLSLTHNPLSLFFDFDRASFRTEMRECVRALLSLQLGPRGVKFHAPCV